MNARKQNSPDAGRLFRIVLVAAAMVSQSCTARTEILPSAHKSDRVTTTTAVNINTASEAELRALPHIGSSLAAKIVEHRSLYGPFRKPEHLLILDGIGETRFSEIRHLVKTE